MHVAPAKVLDRPAVDVEPDDPDAVQLCADLIATMRSHPGCVGLAATQVGVGSRVFCLDVTGHRKAKTCHGLVVLINPQLIAAEDPVLAREGCLSVPDLTGDVWRARRVVVAGSLPVSGERREYVADAFEARAFGHELDHLDGLLFLDRVTSARAVFARKRYQ